MQTVESIIKSIYGRPVAAAAKLSVTPASISNWKAAGYFPSRIIVTLCRDARAVGFELDVSEIPIKSHADDVAA